jgi:hypothetical protein
MPALFRVFKQILNIPFMRTTTEDRTQGQD